MRKKQTAWWERDKLMHIAFERVSICVTIKHFLQRFSHFGAYLGPKKKQKDKKDQNIQIGCCLWKGFKQEMIYETWSIVADWINWWLCKDATNNKRADVNWGQFGQALTHFVFRFISILLELLWKRILYKYLVVWWDLTSIDIRGSSVIIAFLILFQMRVKRREKRVQQNLIHVTVEI